MATYLITHEHAAEQCRIAFASWSGFESPLRRQQTLSSCTDGGHSIWWRIEADNREAALAQLPPWVAERSQVARVREVPIP